MKVEIITGAGWYTKHVGETFEVKEDKTMFRLPNGGMRVEHYVVEEEEPEKVGNMTRFLVIDCRHAVPVPDGRKKRTLDNNSTCCSFCFAMLQSGEEVTVDEDGDVICGECV